MMDENVLRAALQQVWDEFSDLMVFEPVRQQVKDALGIREFEATSHVVPCPTCEGKGSVTLVQSCADCPWCRGGGAASPVTCICDPSACLTGVATSGQPGAALDGGNGPVAPGDPS